jgi:hypothetical protein
MTAAKLEAARDLRHQGKKLQTPSVPLTVPPKRSMASSKPPAESRAASEISPTTDSDAYSPPAVTAPTGSKRQTMPKCDGPVNERAAIFYSGRKPGSLLPHKWASILVYKIL